MLDSIKELIELKNKLDETILSLEFTDHSELLKDIASDLYVKSINDNFKKQIDYISRNFKKYKFHSSIRKIRPIHYGDPPKYIINDTILLKVIGDNILENNILRNCNYFDFPYMVLNDYSGIDLEYREKIEIENSQKNYLHLFKHRKEDMERMVKTSKDSCMVKNLKLILEAINRIK
jgi:hypothetical protein